QHHVAANTQLRKLLCEFLDLAKCRAVGHQCGGGDDAICVRLYDGPIYARCKSEVIRINQETSHSGSLAGGTSYLLWGGRFAPLIQPNPPTVEASEIHGTYVGNASRREAACCERSLGSSMFCASGLRLRNRYTG